MADRTRVVRLELVDQTWVVRLDSSDRTSWQDASSSSGYDANANKARGDKVVSEGVNVAVGPSYDRDTLTKIWILIEVNREAQQANALLTKELDKYKEKEKHFAKETTPESEYCKQIKLLNEDISNLKSQAYKKEKTFKRENEKYDEYVQPLLKRKYELEKIAQTLYMLLPKEDSVHAGRQGLGFENQKHVENPNVLNKAKDLTPCLYDINNIGQYLSTDHKIISREVLESKTKKCLKVKQRKSLLSYHGYVYGLTQFKEPPKVPLKRREVNLEK
ncbi:hypothetical protein Tco_0933884 [Tanacetum coccineum]